jgi:predicted nucleic acid-binding protein
MPSGWPDFLVDTNLFVYAIDATDPVRGERARSVLDRLVGSDRGGISTQVLSELAATLFRRRLPGLGAETIADLVRNIAAAWTVFPVNDMVVIEAVRGVERYQFSYFDAQVWAVARLNAVPMVLTEDFQVGATIEGVTFLNPLDEAFDLDLLGDAP